jgi:hypothetical protein
VSRVRALTADEVADLRGRTRFAEKRSAERVLRMALVTIDRYHGAMETLAQWEPWARQWLSENRPGGTVR